MNSVTTSGDFRFSPEISLELAARAAFRSATSSNVDAASTNCPIRAKAHATLRVILARVSLSAAETRSSAMRYCLMAAGNSPDA